MTLKKTGTGTTTIRSCYRESRRVRAVGDGCGRTRHSDPTKNGENWAKKKVLFLVAKIGPTKIISKKVLATSNVRNG